jgi:SAM-dependent methyltransferase
MILTARKGPVQRLRLAAGLARIRLLERVDDATARRLTALGRRRELRRARRRVAPLRPWDRISERSLSTYTGGPNLVRLSRLVELIPAGRRILDIGIGYGYVTGILLRDRRPSHYCGVDLKAIYAKAALSMIKENDLGDRDVELGLLDIFEIDEEFGRRHDPEIVLVLEVLEHVPDPVAALRAVNAAVRPGTRILFTVPLRGRLDGVWGHVSVFDADRLVEMCREAGLEMIHAEPVHNTWSLVIAEADGRRLADRPPTPEIDSRYAFSPVSVVGSERDFRRPGDGYNVRIESAKAWVRSHIVPGRRGRPFGGLRLPVVSPRVMRVELAIEPEGTPRPLEITARDEAGRVRHAWSARSCAGERETYLFRPGKPTRGLTPDGDDDLSDVRWLDIAVHLKGDEEVTLTVYRAAYLEG